MKKNILILILLLVFFISPTVSNSAVRSIIDDTSTTKDSKPQNLENCVRRGFYLTSCPPNKQPTNFCPSNNKYFKSCTCSPVFKYSRENCKDDKALGGNSCEGKYDSCLCNPKIFTYNRLNCRSPKILDGKYCDGNYEDCKCPDKFSKECTYPLVGNGNKCGNYYTSCKCADTFKTCSGGPDKDAEICIEPKGGMKYSKCFTMPKP